MKKSKSTGSFIPDTSALIIYSLPLGYFVFFFERQMLDFTKSQWFWTHIIYLLHYPAGRLCAKLDDFFSQYFGLEIAGALSLCIYSTPIYFAGAAIAGCNLKQILTGSLIQIAANICFGWLYGLILKWVRSLFNSYTKEVK